MYSGSSTTHTGRTLSKRSIVVGTDECKRVRLDLTEITRKVGQSYSYGCSSCTVDNYTLLWLLIREYAKRLQSKYFLPGSKINTLFLFLFNSAQLRNIIMSKRPLFAGARNNTRVIAVNYKTYSFIFEERRRVELAAGTSYRYRRQRRKFVRRLR